MGISNSKVHPWAEAELSASMTDNTSELSERDETLPLVTPVSERQNQRFNYFTEPLAVRQGKKLLKYVASGEAVAAEKLLHDIPETVLMEHPRLLLDLLTYRADFIDHSGRHFKNITAFEYALWAIDSLMFTKIVKCLPKEEEKWPKDETGKPINIKEKLLMQYKQVMQNGVNYVFEGRVTQESHFNVEPLLDAYRQYQETWSSEVRTNYWCKNVGCLQRQLPIHVLSEYCWPGHGPGDYSFTRRNEDPPYLKYCGYSGTRNEPLLSPNSGFGVDFALFHNMVCDCPYGAISIKSPPADVSIHMLGYTNSLIKKRLCELDELKQLLESPQNQDDCCQNCAIS